MPRTFSIRILRWLAAALLILPTGCAQYSRVKEKQPPPPVAVPGGGECDRAIAEGLVSLESAPMASLGYFLSAADSAAAGLARAPRDEHLVRDAHAPGLDRAANRVFRHVGSTRWR